MMNKTALYYYELICISNIGRHYYCTLRHSTWFSLTTTTMPWMIWINHRNPTWYNSSYSLWHTNTFTLRLILWLFISLCRKPLEGLFPLAMDVNSGLFFYINIIVVLSWCRFTGSPGHWNTFSLRYFSKRRFDLQNFLICAWRFISDKASVSLRLLQNFTSNSRRSISSSSVIWQFSFWTLLIYKFGCRFFDHVRSERLHLFIQWLHIHLNRIQYLY